uniref:Uncharacterized protein n=1 Tax=Proboscia inermis TaxID=420281 RepID=A0A7S0CD03_9STRA
MCCPLLRNCITITKAIHVLSLPVPPDPKTFWCILVWKPYIRFRSFRNNNDSTSDCDYLYVPSLLFSERKSFISNRVSSALQKKQTKLVVGSPKIDHRLPQKRNPNQRIPCPRKN